MSKRQSRGSNWENDSSISTCHSKGHERYHTDDKKGKSPWKRRNHKQNVHRHQQKRDCGHHQFGQRGDKIGTLPRSTVGVDILMIRKPEKNQGSNRINVKGFFWDVLIQEEARRKIYTQLSNLTLRISPQRSTNS